MNISTNPVPAVGQTQRRSGWFLPVLLASGLSGTVLLATPAIGSPGVAFTIDGSARLAGNGLVARQSIGKGSALAWNEPKVAAAEFGRGASLTDGALARLDSGHRDEAFQFSAASPLGVEGLILRSRLHLTKQTQGFGMRRSAANPYQAFPELALAYKLRHDLAVGAEYRFRPDNRNPAGPFGQHAREGAWKDFFFAWSPTSEFSLTASYVDLGRLAPAYGGARQIGHYLSAEFWY